jgi:hypothetical protein
MKNEKFSRKVKEGITNVLSFILLISMFYFWNITLLLLLFITVIALLSVGLIYKLAKYLSNFNTFTDARKNKPWWFIFGDKLYNYILDYIEDSAKAKNINNSITSNKIEEAMEFYSFYSNDELSKSEIKFRWKEHMKIFHPDSGSSPDVRKSQLSNEYKDLLLNYIK